MQLLLQHMLPLSLEAFRHAPLPMHVTAFFFCLTFPVLQGQGGADSERLLAAATLKHWVAYDLEGYVPRSDPLPSPASAACDTGSDLEPGPGCARFNFNAVRHCALVCSLVRA